MVMIGGKKVALHPRCHQRVEARVLGRKWVSRPKKAYRGLVDDAYCGFRPALGAIGRKKNPAGWRLTTAGAASGPGPRAPGSGGAPRLRVRMAHTRNTGYFELLWGSGWPKQKNRGGQKKWLKPCNIANLDIAKFRRGSKTEGDDHAGPKARQNLRGNI